MSSAIGSTAARFSCTPTAEVVAPTGTSYLDAGLAAGTTYTYAVAAVDAAGNASAASTAASATTSSTGTSQTKTFFPTDDATITSASASSTFGHNAKLSVDSEPFENFLIKFVVSGVGSGTVASVKLRLYNINPSKQGGDFYAAASNDWSEGTVTWNTAPATTGSQAAALGAVSLGQFYEVDLTSLVTGDGTYTVRVVSSSNNGADYRSKEATTVSQRPVLTVTYGGA